MHQPNPKAHLHGFGHLEAKKPGKKVGLLEGQTKLDGIVFFKWRTYDHLIPKTRAAQETSLCGEGISVRLRALKFNLLNHRKSTIHF